MCGYIAGKKETIVKCGGIVSLLTKQKHRGTDGYGVLAINEKGEGLYIKSMKQAKIVKWIAKFKGNPYFIVHHRATSVGGTKLKLAHPLIYEDVVLMQNGTKKDVFNMVPAAESDSEALAMLASTMEPEDFSMYMLEDTGVVFWVKNGNLYLNRDESRPLVVNEHGLISSEPLMIGTYREIKEGFYTLSFDDKEMLGIDLGEEVLIDDILSLKKCTKCKKMHRHGTSDKVCNTCLVAGAIPMKEYQSDDIWDYDEYGNYYDWANTNYSKNVEDTDEVYELVVTGMQGVADKVVRGIPVKVGDKYYVVPGLHTDAKAAFNVVCTQYSDQDLYSFRGGNLPLSDRGVPVVVPLEELFPYFVKDKGYYDLIDEVYYLDRSILTTEDEDTLVYDPAVRQYIIPYDYEFELEQYKVY